MTTLACIIAGVLAAIAAVFWVLRCLRSTSRARTRTKKKQMRQLRVPYYF